MKIANYQIEFPISKDFDYQLLYKGFDENKQSFYINLFPKISISEQMYEQITKRLQQYNYVQDILEDDDYILASYQNSGQWQKISPKLTNSELTQYVKQLYAIYSLDESGYYDFDKEQVYVNNNSLFILDYGLRYLELKQKLKQEKFIEYHQTQLMKTWLFGSLVYCLATGIKNSSSLIKLNQSEIDFQVEYHCMQNNIAADNIALIKLLLRLDHNVRPEFIQLQNLPIFRPNCIKTLKSTIITKENQEQKIIKKIDNKSEFFSKSATSFGIKRYQSEDNYNNNSVHHSKIKLAIKQTQASRYSAKSIKDTKLNSFRLASQIIKSTLQKSSIRKSQQIKTQEQFHPTQNSQFNNQSQNFSSKSQYQNLSLNMETITKKKPNQQNDLIHNYIQDKQGNQIQIKPKADVIFKQKTRKSQINSFDVGFFDENDEEEFMD